MYRTKIDPITINRSTMAQPPKRRFGDGATCSVLLKFLRPSREVSEKFPNAVPTQRLDDLVAVCFAVVTRGRSSYPAIFFTTPTFPGIQLQAAKKKVKVLQEGHPGNYWGDVPNVPFELSPALQGPVDARDNDFDDDVFFARNNSEDIARIRAEGFEVDDDNDPALENVPQLWDNAPLLTDAGLYEGQTWGWNGIDRRATEGGNYNGPTLSNGYVSMRACRSGTADGHVQGGCSARASPIHLEMSTTAPAVVSQQLCL